jgi:hypothetical protein
MNILCHAQLHFTVELQIVDSAKNKTKQKHTKASFSTSAANGPNNKFDIF